MNLDVIREVALFDVFPQPTESGLYCDRLCGVGVMGFVTRAVVADSDDDLFVHGRISFWWEVAFRSPLIEYTLLYHIIKNLSRKKCMYMIHFQK